MKDDEVINVTAQRKQALRNAVASAQMEGLTITAQTRQDCERYLDGKIDTKTLVQEALKRYHSQNREVRR